MNFDNWIINKPLTEMWEPLVVDCGCCENTINIFVYFNKKESKFMVGCCLCNKYSEPRDTPQIAVLDWGRLNHEM